MDDNYTSITNKFKKHKGEFVITESRDIQRLIAIGTDDTDYYYIYWDGRKVTWSTCCGRFIPLKGYIPDEDYNRFIAVEKLNCYDVNGELDREEFKWKGNGEEVKKKIETLTLPDKYITEVCWDLN